MTAPTSTMRVPRAPVLERATAMRLAATEYQRMIELLRSLRPQDWTNTTDCPGWDVRAVAAHVLGMAEMAASLREQLRQMKAAAARGGDPLDALTALQVEERADMKPDAIITRFARVAPRAARGRRWAPSFIRRRAMPQLQLVDGHAEPWTVGYLVDVILTRDPWMHRIDICRATGADHVLTPEHDGVLVDDLVTEWAQRHGQPFTLRLTGPAGGSWTVGVHGPNLELDGVEFCRAISGRHPTAGLLSTQVPF